MRTAKVPVWAVRLYRFADNMPYSVPPPPLPPLVNVQLPEETSQPAPSSAIATPIASAAPEFTPIRIAEPLPEELPALCPSGGAVTHCSLPVVAEPEPRLTLAATAETLGAPMEVSLPVGQPPLSIASPIAAPEAEWSEVSSVAFLPLPDLDVLLQSATPPGQRATHQTQSIHSASRRGAPAVGRSATASSQSRSAQLPPDPTPTESNGRDNRSGAGATFFVPTESVSVEADQAPDSSTPTAPTELSVPADLPEVEPTSPSLPTPQPTGGQTLTIPTPNSTPESAQPTDSEQPESEQTPPPPQRNPRRRPGRPGAPSTNGVVEQSVLEVTADRQEYNERRQTVEAEGDAVLRFRRGVLSADRVQVNVANRFIVAEGNALLRRGQQLLRGDRFDYNFGLNQGNILGAGGELFIPATTTDFNPTLPTDVSAQTIGTDPSVLGAFQVLGSAGGLTFGLNTPGQSSSNPQGGQINRLRFEAEQATFAGDQVTATNVRLTNDPFSPPELELRANQVTYTRLTPLQAEIRARNPRLVFDQGFTLPLPFNRFVIDNREREPGFFRFGFDEKDRDGFFIERPFEILTTPEVLFTVTPQILVQRAIEQGFDASSLGLVTRLTATLTPSTTLTALANFSSLESDDIGDSLRASARLRQQVYGHTVALEYSYRDRLFNGSLGFQDVQNSAGVVVTSPTYTLGTSGVTFSYQGGIQFVNAQTDRSSLYPNDRNDRELSCIPPDERDTTGNGCANLVRYQATAAASRPFLLWYGKTLPATPTEGLRYSPNPITPYLILIPSVRGVYSAYSNGSSQSSFTGSLTLAGQFGHFSKPFLDYTSFNLSYSAVLLDGESPFLFDRVDDLQILSAGITQQIYGPVRFGVQATYNLDTGDEIDTVFTLEYVRRTYALTFNYSVKREAASIGLRINDFNWTGSPGPFSGVGAPAVSGGVIRND